MLTPELVGVRTRRCTGQVRGGRVVGQPAVANQERNQDATFGGTGEAMGRVLPPASGEGIRREQGRGESPRGESNS